MKLFTRLSASLFCAQLGLMFTLFSGVPAEAAIQRSADFSQGQTIGLGLYGISYDYALGWFSAGAYASSTRYDSNLAPDMNDPPQLGLRFLARSYEKDNLSVGWLAGMHVRSQKFYDQDRYRQRNALLPDLGMSVAYNFAEFDIPFVLRMNLTLGLSLGNDDIFQRLQFGPQTGLELAWQPREDLEITLGGGTLMGMRLKF